ncbi:hypothetical protein [Rhizobium ruizarguesonis]|uniref:hypothetical protein n=1 Tax=Rhizobium ruizarguesonis TaxID=2081791 RepID=UPI001030CD5B|nr:hypothetical protein [Rhizobium ruizarguesonis]TAW60508.1 hypothetical protein ELI10_38005 [Rhizobium ruizarguesonis]TAX01300.1 hypothetical protein ELI09_37900 [Rhizobium ruizarguesonis]TAX02978.1 hypothetical protein ELI08_37955 [Rhizobium ruizarguesonis]
MLVDGHISQRLKAEAIASRDPKGFFNKRCHDYGLSGRRLIVYDTVTTNEMGGRGASAARLHFHGIIEQPDGMRREEFIGRLEAVFGRASVMGKRQFHVTSPNWKNYFTFGGVQVHGPLGKLMYAIKHSGSAYVSLGLNEAGKRSRKAPASRRACNRGAQRLAKSNPSHFNRAVVFFDRASKQAGERAFNAWVAAERAKRRPVPASTVNSVRDMVIAV